MSFSSSSSPTDASHSQPDASHSQSATSHSPTDASHNIASRSNATNSHGETVSRGTGQSHLINARPQRRAKAPGYLSDYHCPLTQISTPDIPSKTVYPLSSLLSYSAFKPLLQSYVLSYSIKTEPTSFKQAVYKSLCVSFIQKYRNIILNISNAFLHSDLDEEIYMSLPQGYTPAPGTTLPPNPV